MVRNMKKNWQLSRGINGVRELDAPCYPSILLLCVSKGLDMLTSIDAPVVSAALGADLFGGHADRRRHVVDLILGVRRELADVAKELLGLGQLQHISAHSGPLGALSIALLGGHSRAAAARLVRVEGIEELFKAFALLDA